MRDIQYPGRSVVMCAKGMVATSQPMATQVGLDILRRGGNAMDAAIAASATLCVTEPQSTGIGGDCFILYHEAKAGKLHGYNGSGRAPARATLEEYRKRGLSEMPERGMLTVSVPGAIEGWETALERFGTMSFSDVLQPAMDFAEGGYAVSPVVAKFWKRPAEAAEQLRAARGRLAEVPSFDPYALEHAIRQLAADKDVGAGKIIHPLRVAQMGTSVSPGIFVVLSLMGRERALGRIDRALGYLDAMAAAEASEAAAAGADAEAASADAEAADAE